MSTEHETVMAKMALLQGTIDQRKRTLGSSTAALNANSQPRSSSVSLFASSAQQQSSQTQANSSLSSTFPVVSRTTWQSTTAPNRQPMTSPLNLRTQTRGLTKLVLNQPNRAVQIKPPPSSALIPSINLISPSPSLDQPHSSTTSLLNNPFQALYSKPILTAIPESLPQSPAANQLPSSSTSPLSDNPAPSRSPISSINPNPSSLPSLANSLSNKSVNSDSKPLLLATRPTTPTNHNELVINGVSFVRDTQGKKLVRKTEPFSSSQSEKAPGPSSNVKALLKDTEKKPTPIKALIGGMTYIRTKSGNLVELSALQKFQSQKLQELKKARLLNTVNAMKAKYQSNHNFAHWDSTKVYSKPIKVTRPPLIKKNKQCQFFAKTGACRNGLTCVYQHDPSQVAICPRFLRRRCPHSANSCPLSHVPNAHNMEHCSHFPRCNKSDCPYPHVQATTSQICQEFADLGWCSKGAQCTERHVRECPEFSTKGTCSNVGCRLRHMINRNTNDNDDNQAAETGPSDEDGGGLFFTDLTGTGKRKELSSNSRVAQKSPHGQPKGISHNSDRPIKRTKYDAMADNDDYVMFISSDEEAEASSGSEKSKTDDEPDAGDEPNAGDEPASSIDSEELERVSLDKLPEGRYQLNTCLDAQFNNIGLPSSHDSIIYHHTVQNRMRSRLGSEEIEEGEIFEDDDIIDHIDDDHGISIGKEFVTDSFVDENSSDEDELVARQLVGDRLRSLAL